MKALLKIALILSAALFAEAATAQRLQDWLNLGNKAMAATILALVLGMWLAMLCVQITGWRPGAQRWSS